MNRQKLKKFRKVFDTKRFNFNELENCLHSQMYEFAASESFNNVTSTDAVRVTDEFFGFPKGFSHDLRYNADELWEKLVGIDFEDYTAEIALKVIDALIQKAGV